MKNHQDMPEEAKMKVDDYRTRDFRNMRILED